MDIILLIIILALLDVGMICYSLHLDHQIAKLKDVGMITDVPYPVARMGRFERFAHSPLGTTLLAICFFGMLIAMKEAEKHDDPSRDASGVTQTVPENPLTTIPRIAGWENGHGIGQPVNR